ARRPAPLDSRSRRGGLFENTKRSSAERRTDTITHSVAFVIESERDIAASITGRHALSVCSDLLTAASPRARDTSARPTDKRAPDEAAAARAVAGGVLSGRSTGAARPRSFTPPQAQDQSLSVSAVHCSAA
ncbi:hypothetical protein SFRURICE_018167, partial [Spodoptera frugiperda]